MKKRLIVPPASSFSMRGALLMVCACSVLVGCGESETQPASTDPSSTSAASSTSGQGGGNSGGAGGGGAGCDSALWMGLCCTSSSCDVRADWEPTAQIAEGFALAAEALSPIDPDEELRFREIGFAAKTPAGVPPNEVQPDAFKWWFAYGLFHVDAPGATIVLLELNTHEMQTFEDLGGDVYHLLPDEVAAAVKVSFHEAALRFAKENTFSVLEGFLRQPLVPTYTAPIYFFAGGAEEGDPSVEYDATTGEPIGGSAP
jgi:hypothetical protein